jgi:hypothetical protein
MRIRTGLVLGLLVALGVAGCGGADGGDGVATAGGATSAPPSAAAGSGAEKDSVLRYAQCMRDNGVPDFPDPEVGEGGEYRLSVPEGLDMTKMRAAEQKCRQHMPNGGQPKEIDPERLDQMRQYAKCMRENGVPNFPDPSGGGFQLDMNELGMSGPDDPKLKAAEEACNDLMPGPGPGATRESRSEG